MKDRKRREFNIHLNTEDRNIIDKLLKHNINVSGVFKTFIRKYLEQIETIDVNPNIQN